MRAGPTSKTELLAEIKALQGRLSTLEAQQEYFLAAEQALRQSEDRYRRLLESVTDYVYTVSVRNGVPVATSHGANCVAVTGYTAEEYRQNPLLWISMVPDVDRPEVLAQAGRILSGGEVAPIEHSIVHKDGTLRYVRNTPVVHRDAAGAVVSYDGIIIDITERKRAEELITRMSLHDGLTGLPNRALYMDRLRHALDLAQRRDEKVAVYFIDLDHFKDVNDVHGHDVGDAVLAAVAKRLLGCVRHSDTVARLGGDEFVALTPAIGDAANAAAIAEKMVAVMHAPMEVLGKTCQLGASVGVALYPDDGSRGGVLLRLADAAMYAAKKAGRNGWRMVADLPVLQSAKSENIAANPTT
jgi:diguanylate cyclase (GGDEF)-like protein/PAS domain S-box-containing protein